MAAAVIAANWIIANTLFFFFQGAAVNYLGPLKIVMIFAFWQLWHAKSLKGAYIHRTFFVFYCIYLLISVWHLIGRFFFPDTFAATYYFSLAASNGVFILIVLTLWLFGILKFIQKYVDGGMDGIFDRNRDKWSKKWWWF